MQCAGFIPVFIFTIKLGSLSWVRTVAFFSYLHKIWERKVKTLTKNWRDHHRTGTHKLNTRKPNQNISMVTVVFLSQKRLRKKVVTIKIFQFSSHVPILRWSLQFLVRVFSFLSLILCYSYFGTFLSTWSFLIEFILISFTLKGFSSIILVKSLSSLFSYFRKLQAL